MRKCLLVTAGLMLTLGFVNACGDTAGSGSGATESFGTPNSIYVASLVGENEVPEVTSASAGVAIFEVDAAETEVRFTIRTIRATVISQAHIHVAPEGANGDIAVFLFGPFDPPRGSEELPQTGVFRAADFIGVYANQSLSELIDEFEAGTAYVNLHSTDFPAGEIRGQIAPVATDVVGVLPDE